MTRTSTSTSALLVMAAGLAGCASNPPGTASAQGGICKPATQRETAALLDRWNSSLQMGDPRKVVTNFTEKSVLLATVSNTPRDAAQKEEYFKHFLENRPRGRIDCPTTEVDCNTALDTDLHAFKFAKPGDVVKARYTYTYKWSGSQWLITRHHSSAMPEK